MRPGRIERPTPALGEPRSIQIELRAQIATESFLEKSAPVLTTTKSLDKSVRAQVTTIFFKKNLRQSQLPLIL